MVLDADPEDEDWPESVRDVCKALAGRDAATSTKESIVLAQRICKAAVGSKESVTLYDRCLGYDCRQDVTLHDRFRDLMMNEWKTMPKNGHRAWEHIAHAHNHLPYCKYKRAVFLRWMTPVSGIEAYCAHRIRSVHPCNTDELRDWSEKVYDFFRNVPKSMPAFKVTFQARSPAYHGWLIVKPMIDDWFKMRNDERAGWIAGALAISMRAAKQIDSEDDGEVLGMHLKLLQEHGNMETHTGLEWMRFFNAARPLVGERKKMVFGSANMYVWLPTDELGREGWCRTDTYEESMKSDAFRRAVTNNAPKMDSTFHTLDLEFGEDDNPGILSKACVQAIRQGVVTSWRVGVSNPKRLGKRSTPLVASEVILAHEGSGCSTHYTMTAKIKPEWLKANPPPLRDGVPHGELLGWFKGTWLAELLTLHSNTIETIRIGEEVERQKRKDAALSFRKRMPANMEAGMQALATSFLAGVESEQCAERAAATKLQARWRGREARRGCALKEDSFVFTDIASTRATALEAALAAFESGDHKVKAKKRKPKKPLPLPPPVNAHYDPTYAVPTWWPLQLAKQVPLGTNRIFPVSSLFKKLELGNLRGSWVLGSVWPTHVEEARPPRTTTIVELDQHVELARIDPEWNRVFAITESAKKSGLVAKWVVGFSYTHDELGREITPPDIPKYTKDTVACAFASTIFSEATLTDGRVDTLTVLKEDAFGDCIVNMHFQRLVFQTTRENTNVNWLASCRAEDEQRANHAAEALLLEEDKDQLQKATKAKKKAETKRAREEEQIEKVRLVREASEAAKQVLDSKHAASVAAHAEEQRRIAKSKKEERERAEVARFEAVLAKKRAAEAEATAEKVAVADAVAADAALAIEHALKEAREAAERAHAEEAERVRKAQVDLMARLRENAVPALAQTVASGKGRGRLNAGRGGRGGRGATPTTPAPPPKPEEGDDSKLCVVCFEDKKSRVCIPCGHVCMCKNCASNKAITTCPMCRVEITMIIQCFF